MAESLVSGRMLTKEGEGAAHDKLGQTVKGPRFQGLAGVSAHRLGFIDFLRAVAILLVFSRHALEVFVPFGRGGRIVFDMTGRLNCGALGVAIFFAVSGFLIPSSLHGPRLQGSVRYVISRIFRLYPAFLVSVIPSAWAHFWLGGKTLGWGEVALNATMVPRLFGGQLANGAYWTLEVEAAFYGICLLLFLGGVIGESFAFGAITLAAFLIFQSSQQVFFGGLFNPELSGAAFFFNLHIALMCWGALCRFWWDGKRLSPLTALIFWSFAAYWAVYQPLLFMQAALHHRLAHIDTNLIAAYSLGVIIFGAAVLQGGAHRGLLRNRLLLWIGRISYSFYLLHGVAIHLIQYELNAHHALWGLQTEIYCAFALVVSLALAQLSFWLVETPGIRLGRAISTRILSLHAVAARSHTRAARRVAAFTAPLLARPAAGNAGLRALSRHPGTAERSTRTDA